MSVYHSSVDGHLDFPPGIGDCANCCWEHSCTSFCVDIGFHFSATYLEVEPLGPTYSNSEFNILRNF